MISEKEKEVALKAYAHFSKEFGSICSIDFLKQSNGESLLRVVVDADVREIDLEKKFDGYGVRIQQGRKHRCFHN